MARSKKARRGAKHCRTTTKKRKSGKRGNMKNLVRMPTSQCGRCGRTIFGGPKGMRTHMRKKHRGSKR